MGGMTDRHSGYVVTLAENLREDDAQGIINAIRQLRGVLAADPVPAEGAVTEFLVARRERDALRTKLLDLARAID